MADQDIHPTGTTPISSQAKTWTPKQPLNLGKLVDIDGPQGALNRPDDSDPDKPNKEGLYRGRHPSRSTILAAPAGPNWGEEGLPGEGTATATATMVPVGTPLIVTPGAGYLVGDELSVTGGTKTETAVVVVDSVGTTLGQDETAFDSGEDEGSFTGGAGYSVSQTIFLSDGSAVIVDAAPTGAVTEFTITTKSTTGHTANNDTLTQTGVSGESGPTGFTLTLNDLNQEVFAASNKQVVGETVGDYTVLPADPVATTGSAIGTGATFNIDWGVKDITVTDGGIGYAAPPDVQFGGAGGVGSVGLAVLVDTAVSSITTIDPGSGYTERATVAMPAS